MLFQSFHHFRDLWYCRLRPQRTQRERTHLIMILALARARHPFPPVLCHIIPLSQFLRTPYSPSHHVSFPFPLRSIKSRPQLLPSFRLVDQQHRLLKAFPLSMWEVPLHKAQLQLVPRSLPQALLRHHRRFPQQGRHASRALF